MLAYKSAYADVNVNEAILHLLYEGDTPPANTGERIRIAFIPPPDVYKFGPFEAAPSAVFIPWPQIWNPV